MHNYSKGSIVADNKDKIQHSKRRQQDENAVQKQVKIAKAHLIPVDEPHKLAKKHAVNCGNPKCVLCGNPRRMFKEPSQQEKRMFQDVDTPRDKRSNGLNNNDVLLPFKLI